MTTSFLKKPAAVSQVNLCKKKSLKIMQIEALCKEFFKVNLNVKKILLEELPTSNCTYTTIFITNHNAIYALCTSDELIQLADVKNIIKSMGMKAEEYLPPNADDGYFFRCGLKKFQSVYPDRRNILPEETTFYQTLTTYNPALVKIEKIDGEIRQYSESFKQWQKTLDLSYMRLKVK